MPILFFRLRRGRNVTVSIKTLPCCPLQKKCGGCAYQGIPYEEQLREKENLVRKLLKGICDVEGIRGMEEPYHYRNKVNATFKRLPGGRVISGTYSEGSHRVVEVEDCLIEDERADAIIGDIRKLLPSFKIMIFNEDTGRGLLRHVLVRTGRKSGQVMVVLVLSSPVMPSKNNFVKELVRLHPEITTIVINVNGRKTSMILGNEERVIYGKGFIEDELLGITFRISPKSFYQINPVQTEKLYSIAIEKAGLSAEDRVLDAYCGIGTISLIAAGHAGAVTGVELNRDAVRDAINNAKTNGIRNVRFYADDAGRFMKQAAARSERPDVVFMDPPR
ncbi:MAG: 23S rRNA (uracil(1939)-C(5))-methyltransferase RlmD, partial [Lachnospiraceae bacterium]|nr:23S rRNA (uracil(1939)-C(5))-methyltransferase RlmD [Lachnospiraceae bacterium]